MEKEYLELCDKNGKSLGKTILRGNKPNAGEFIRLVLVCMENSEGQLLIQKTSKNKDGKHAFTGGHVKAGQSCKEACIDEILEELGIEIKNKEIQFVNKFIYKESALFYVYHALKDFSLEELKLQKEEVEFVKWLDKNEIEFLISIGELRETSALAFSKIQSLHTKK